MRHFYSETTNENNQFSKWEIWIFNAIFIKLLGRFVNFEELGEKNLQNEF